MAQVLAGFDARGFEVYRRTPDNRYARAGGLYLRLAAITAPRMACQHKRIVIGMGVKPAWHDEVFAYCACGEQVLFVSPVPAKREPEAIPF